MAIGSQTRNFAEVMARTGLAAAGASSGLFVAAHLAKAGVESLSSTEFVLAMMVSGAIGFYMGIDLPARRSEATPVETLSAVGTFLAPVAALLSVYYIILVVDARHVWSIVIGLCWLLGVTLQIAAGTIVRVFNATAGRRSRSSSFGQGQERNRLHRSSTALTFSEQRQARYAPTICALPASRCTQQESRQDRVPQPDFVPLRPRSPPARRDGGQQP